MTLTAEQLTRLSAIDTYSQKGQFRCGEFACWTEGHLIVALKTDYDPKPGQPHYAQIPDLLSADQKWIATGCCSTEALLKWCRAPKCSDCKSTGVVVCKTCHGSKMSNCRCACGDLHHTINCDDCDGTGKASCRCAKEYNAGKLLAAVFDRNLIRRALELSAASGQLTISIQPKNNILDIRWEDGVICLMPLRIEETCEEFKF